MQNNVSVSLIGASRHVNVRIIKRVMQEYTEIVLEAFRQLAPTNALLESGSIFVIKTLTSLHADLIHCKAKNTFLERKIKCYYKRVKFLPVLRMINDG